VIQAYSPLKKISLRTWLSLVGKSSENFERNKQPENVGARLKARRRSREAPVKKGAYQI